VRVKKNVVTVSNPRDTDYLKAAVIVAFTQITPQMLNDTQKGMVSSASQGAPIEG